MTVMSDARNLGAQHGQSTEFSFVIREIKKTHAVVAANSYQEARRIVEERYDDSEYILDHNRFEDTEFIPCCSLCGEQYETGAGDWREVDSESPQAMILCENCVSEMMNTGKILLCRNCYKRFSTSRLVANPRNNAKELCPYCGDVWQE